MDSSQSRACPSKLLISVAQKASGILDLIAKENECGPVVAIATHLQEIAKFSTLEIPELHHETENICLQALQDLLQIYEWPEPAPPRTQHRISDDTARDVYYRLVPYFDRQGSIRRARESIEKFCREKADKILPLQSRFRHLLTSLGSDIRELEDDALELNQAANLELEPLEKDVYPLEVHTLLLNGMKRHAYCTLENDIPSLSAGTLGDKAHCTRLCLNSGFRSNDRSALFNLIIAHSDMRYWQEMAINVPIYDPDQSLQQLHASPESPERINVCELINYEINAEIHAEICLDLNDEYHLYGRSQPTPLEYSIAGCNGITLPQLIESSNFTVENKLRLSYDVARAFWQLYNSDFMDTRWTSEDILFMPIDEEAPSEWIPLRAFISFPFGSSYEKSPVECYHGQGYYTHYYPRILHLGIILLEIGLGQVISLDECRKLNSFGRANKTHRKAKKKLKELKRVQWNDDFHWKNKFVQAVENCLEPSNFTITSNGLGLKNQSNIGTDKNATVNTVLSGRRDALYKKVVAPLFWLAREGFQDSTADIPLVQINHKSSHKPAPILETQSLSNGVHTIPPLPSQVAENSHDATGFLGRLQKIAYRITACRQEAEVTSSIRVAILDTGCNKDLPFFKNSKRAKRLKRWKDFTLAGASHETDLFGHGTYMTRLLMHVAPTADIYLIRIAESTEDLDKSADNIAQAIELAGLDPDWKVDIISMSFGFPSTRDEPRKIISEAISKVVEGREGSILFLASAGNESARNIDFPASHKDVIPLYATGSDGQFLPSNPAQTDKGTARLGTYGDGIPSCIVKEISDYFPTADLKAGTSIAAAIATGIIAMTLSYAEALPTLVEFPNAGQICAILRTKEGMEHMLLKDMSTTPGNDQQRFLDPIWYWGESKLDMVVFAAVFSAWKSVNST